MVRKYANNYSSTLNGAITNVQTTITVGSATGLPSIGAGETYRLTIDDGTNIEVVEVTDDASSPTLTVTRGVDGTSGTAFADGDTVELRATAASFTDVLAADETPALVGPLDMSASGVYASFGGSSSSTAYNLTHSGGVPRLTGAANFYYGFTSTKLYMQAGSTFHRMEFASGNCTFYTTNLERFKIDSSGVTVSNGALAVDNITIDANTISSTDTNGDINLTPDGTGNVAVGNYTFDADQTVGAGQDNYVLTYDNATGLISLEAATGGGGGLSAVVDDTTPQLGGNLDCNSYNIQFDNATGITDDSTNEYLMFAKSTSAVNYVQVVNAPTGAGPIFEAEGADTNVDLRLRGKGTGYVDVGQVKFPASGAADGTLLQISESGGNYYITYPTITGLGILQNVVEDTTPQLGGNLDVNGNEIQSTSLGDIVLHSDNDVNIILGDDSGVDDLNIKDVFGVTVAGIDSNGNITTSGTVDGRDVATDGAKLDGIEASADVTDEANVTAALDGATLTAVTVATNDKVLIQDADDIDNLKTVTTQAIADLKDADLLNDTSPQLGGNLDANTYSIQFDNNTGINDSNNNEQIRFVETASAVNHLDVTNAAASGSPKISTAGTDTNIDLDIVLKGSGGLKINGSTAKIDNILDEDTMSSNSATALATQQSIKAYVDNFNSRGFKVRRTTAQSISASTDTKIQWDTEDLDTEGDFDSTTNYRHTPSIAGKWLYICRVALSSIDNGANVAPQLFKNGSLFSSTALYNGATGTLSIESSTIVDMNGSTDYMEVYAFHGSAASRNTNTTVGYQPEFIGIYLGT